MATAIQTNAEPERGVTIRREFSADQVQSSAELAGLAVAARERAKIEAQFLMAERHPRDWNTVRVRLLSHCDRPGFAEIARYKKPAGRKKVNGQWVDVFAEGLSARFAEIARQEAGNLSIESSIVHEDDLIRVVRASVMDLERNNLDSREITVAKAVERRGKQDKQGNWEPPEGREVIGNPRLNSFGEPVWLVKATEDEIRNRQNSEISKVQRDESLRLIPKDIRDDCEARVLAVLADPKKVDPTAARKKLIDAFAKLSILPDDLLTYLGCSVDKASPAQIDELRGLWTAINDGEIDFQTALKMKYDQPSSTTAERDAVLDQKLTEAAAQAAISKPRAEEPQKPETQPLEGRLADAAQVLTSNMTALRPRYTRETIPDAESVPEGTECDYEGGKVLRSTNAGPDQPRAWKTIEEPVVANPAPKQTTKPVFGRRQQ